MDTELKNFQERYDQIVREMSFLLLGSVLGVSYWMFVVYFLR